MFVKLSSIAVYIFMAVGVAHAQSVMDGSDRTLSDSEKTTLLRLMEDASTDPYSIQIRRITKQGPPANAVCGEMNSKDRGGGYLGFRRFVAFPDKSTLFAPYDKYGGVNRSFDPIITSNCG